MTKRSSLAPFLLLAVLFAGVWMYFTPWLALRKIQAAAERGDAQALNEMVDFPAFRESVKQNVRSAVSRGIAEDSGNPLAALGGMLAGALAAPAVDALVTPEAIAAFTQGQRPDGDGKNGGGDPIDVDLEVKREYETLDRFVVHFHDSQSGEERVALVMRREGLAGWKLVGVRLPDARERN